MTAGGNVTAGSGRSKGQTLVLICTAAAWFAFCAQATGDPLFSLLAFCPNMLLNYRAMKPNTKAQYIGTIILWIVWSIFGAVAITFLSLGFLHPSWGSIFPCMTIFSVRCPSKPERLGYALQRWMIMFTWDPPFLCTLWLCEKFGITLLHDGNAQYITICDDDICIAAVPFSKRLPELEAAKVSSVVNMCWEYAGPIADYERHGILQLRLPTLDTTSPSAPDLKKGVAFIQEQLQRCPGRRVLIHCKGGRGRAACMAAAWYISKGMTPSEAVSFLRSKRPVVEKVIGTYEPLQEFAASVSKHSAS